MMTVKQWHLLFLLIYLSSTAAYAQDEWELKRNENGIEVYTRKLTEGKFKEIKIHTTLQATPEQLAAVLMDVDKHKEWVYGISKSYAIKKVSNKSIIYYNEVDMPWPVSDRDLISQLNVQKEPKTGKTIIQSQALPDHIPPKNGIVRIPYAAAHWEVTPVAAKEIKIEYTFRVDPGGSLPAWLVNSIASVGPYNSFVELRKRLEKMNE